MTYFREGQEEADHRFDLSHYDLETKPLSAAAEKEVRSKISNGHDGAVLFDRNNAPYAVILKTTEFNLLIGLIDLSLNAVRYWYRAKDMSREVLTFAQFKQRLKR